MRAPAESTISEVKMKIHHNLFNTNQLILIAVTNFRTFYWRLIDSRRLISWIRFSYDTDDGQSRDEELTILNKDTDEEEIVIKGSYSYTGTDGLIYRVDYTADRNGYHANVHKPVAHQSEANVNKPVAYQSEAIVSPAVAVAQTPAQDASS